MRIAREEGVTTLWRGAIPTMGRAMVVNAAQLASYSQAKQAILQSGESCRSILAVSIRRRSVNTLSIFYKSHRDKKSRVALKFYFKVMAPGWLLYLYFLKYVFDMTSSYPKPSFSRVPLRS